MAQDQGDAGSEDKGKGKLHDITDSGPNDSKGTGQKPAAKDGKPQTNGKAAEAPAEGSVSLANLIFVTSEGTDMLSVR